MSQSGRDKTLARSGRSADQQVLRTLEPVALAKLSDLAAAKVALRGIVNVLERGVETKLSGLDQSLLTAVSSRLQFILNELSVPIETPQKFRLKFPTCK